MIRTYLAFASLILSLSLEAQQKRFVNSIGMEFVRIEPGSFIVGKFEPPYPQAGDTTDSNGNNLIMWMGDGRAYNAKELEDARSMATKDKQNGFSITLEQPYYIGKFEVTQAQWKRVMKTNPSTFLESRVADSDDHPVENISWEDAKEFINRLNKLEGKNKYRLPTEFEWEFAARGGEYEKDIPWKDIQETAALGGKSTYKVGSKKPNGYGLYDMLGNVWEWVEDVYNEKIFADPTPPKKGKTHVLKGASFAGDVKNATYMTHAGGPGNGWDVGFRVVMVVHEKQNR